VPTDTNAEPQPFHCDQGDGSPDVDERGPEIHDLALVEVDGERHLAIVASPPEQAGIEPRQREIHVWWFDTARRVVERLDPRAVDLPLPKEVALGAAAGRIIAAGTNNFEWPAFIGRWGVAPGWTGVAGTLDATVATLTGPQAASVTVPMKWSTAGIGCAQWLYAPRLHPAAGGPGVLVSMETTDGQAALWRYDPPGGRVAPVAMIPSTVDPVIFPRGDGMEILRRLPDPSWSGFHDGPRYSFARGPVALPVSLIEVGPDGALRRERQPDLGPCFAFDAAPDPAGGFIIAAAGGSLEQPLLAVYRAAALGLPYTVVDTLPLPHPPIEVRVLAADGGILLALLYQVSGVRSVQGYYRAPTP
jgi:hypothetical protein